MKILYIIDSLVPAGAERSLAAMAPLLVEQGIDLDVAYLKEVQGLQQEIRDSGARLFSLAGPGGRPSRIQRCRRLIAAEQPDLVHTTLFEADVAGRTAAWLKRTPVVTSLVGLNYGPHKAFAPDVPGWKLRLAQGVDIATARLATRFHAVSWQIAETMSSRLRIPRRQIEVIPRGRDPRALGVRSAERRERARRDLGIASGVPMVLAAARHEYAKGLDILLRAVPQVLAGNPTVRFVIAGREGLQTERLRAIAAEGHRASPVDFLGGRDDVFELMCAADVFVVPSRREGSPGVVLEAMALEAPIVASSLPSIRELVDDDSAVLVPSQDPASLALGILASLATRASARERAHLARQRFIEHFTLDRVVDQMLRFYETALSAS